MVRRIPWGWHSKVEEIIEVTFSPEVEGKSQGSGSGFIHCRYNFCSRTGRVQCKRKTCTLKGVICRDCYCRCPPPPPFFNTFLLWLPMCGRQPLVTLCLLLMKMQWQSLQQPHSLPACSSQQHFLWRMSSCTAQSCCLESWNHRCGKFHVCRWVWDSTSSLECSYGSEHLDPMIKCWHLRWNQLLVLPSVRADPTVILSGGQRHSAVIHVF